MIFDMQMEAMEDPHPVQEKAKILYDEEFSHLEMTFRNWEQNSDPGLLKEVEMILARLKYLQNLRQVKS